ncbi:hypothetical protein SDC9_07824 [bioreactor metagenome]|uniref:DUF218 domain-containing protein n=1 Tax=bioreactor metagenome TaxID=1076179 RepID=A0A644T615_9ZZZZ|nr:ElyC/SanA/YdcF family protein [Candidatus Elulimicrobiales bacterium]
MKNSRIKVKKWLKVGISILAIFLVLFFAISLIVYFYISNYSKEFIYDSAASIPKNKAGLVLGTSPVTKAGSLNLFFINRMTATKDLLDAEKIDYAIVSGDNRTVAYNEPKYMKNYLLKLNVDEHAIVSDYAGRRTLDSVLRSNEVFNQNEITIISQKYHNERAIFIARKNGINAVAYNAKYPFEKFSDNIYINAKNFLREILARDLAVIDILTHKRPAILGNSIEIENEKIEGVKRLILE